MIFIASRYKRLLNTDKVNLYFLSCRSRSNDKNMKCIYIECICRADEILVISRAHDIIFSKKHRKKVRVINIPL